MAAEQQRRQKSKGTQPERLGVAVSLLGVADEPARALNAGDVASQILEALVGDMTSAVQREAISLQQDEHLAQGQAGHSYPEDGLQKDAT